MSPGNSCGLKFGGLKESLIFHSPSFSSVAASVEINDSASFSNRNSKAMAGELQALAL